MVVQKRKVSRVLLGWELVEVGEKKRCVVVWSMILGGVGDFSPNLRRLGALAAGQLWRCFNESKEGGGVEEGKGPEQKRVPGKIIGPWQSESRPAPTSICGVTSQSNLN